MKTSKAKAKIRDTAEWKKLRIRIADRQMNKDFITGKPLRKGWQVHHLDMSFENYGNFNDDSHFIGINRSTHEVVHTLYRYYRNDKNYIVRIVQVLDEMLKLNEKEKQ